MFCGDNEGDQWPMANGQSSALVPAIATTTNTTALSTQHTTMADQVNADITDEREYGAPLALSAACSRQSGAASAGDVCQATKINSATSSASTPAHIDSNVPSLGLISQEDALYKVLAHHVLVLERQLEGVEGFIDFEHAHKYALFDVNGVQLGWALEQEGNWGKAIARQTLRDHRPFKFDVVNMQNEILMRIERPLEIVNSHLTVTLPDGRVLGKCEHKWHITQRKYTLYVNDNEKGQNMKEFGNVGGKTPDWEFIIHGADNGKVIGSVDRDTKGVIRETFTNTGVYVLRMNPKSLKYVVHNQKELGDRS
jgi:hypothetical protein